MGQRDFRGTTWEVKNRFQISTKSSTKIDMIGKKETIKKVKY